MQNELGALAVILLIVMVFQRLRSPVSLNQLLDFCEFQSICGRGTHAAAQLRVLGDGSSVRRNDFHQLIFPGRQLIFIKALEHVEHDSDGNARTWRCTEYRGDRSVG